MTEKRCSKCKELKPISEFWKDRRAKSGLMAYCKACGKVHNSRRIVPEGKLKHRRPRKSPDGITKRDKIAFIQQRKEQPCECCGTFDWPGAMDFHHRDPDTKSFSLGKVQTEDRGTFTLEEIEQEITKCVLLCNSCHRKVHSNLVCLLPA